MESNVLPLIPPHSGSPAADADQDGRRPSAGLLQAFVVIEVAMVLYLATAVLLVVSAIAAWRGGSGTGAGLGFEAWVGPVITAVFLAGWWVAAGMMGRGAARDGGAVVRVLLRVCAGAVGALLVVEGLLSAKTPVGGDTAAADAAAQMVMLGRGAVIALGAVAWLGLFLCSVWMMKEESRRLGEERLAPRCVRVMVGAPVAAFAGLAFVVAVFAWIWLAAQDAIEAVEAGRMDEPLRFPSPWLMPVGFVGPLVGFGLYLWVVDGFRRVVGRAVGSGLSVSGGR